MGLIRTLIGQLLNSSVTRLRVLLLIVLFNLRVSARKTLPRWQLCKCQTPNFLQPRFQQTDVSFKSAQEEFQRVARFENSEEHFSPFNT